MSLLVLRSECRRDSARAGSRPEPFIAAAAAETAFSPGRAPCLDACENENRDVGGLRAAGILGRFACYALAYLLGLGPSNRMRPPRCLVLLLEF